MKTAFWLTSIVLLLSGCDSDTDPVDSGGGEDAAMIDAGPTGPIDVMVETADGPVIGVLESGIHTFWGLPYAETPAGDARWTPPVAPAAWTDPRDARERGVQCAQRGTGDASGVEDCLHLNVWTPELSPESPLPVMVWIHGGAFAVGAGNDPGYDAQSLLSGNPVVVVTINYRLGELGYLAHPALTAEAGGTSGNYGLLDQIEALRWVQRNAGRFGGDASNVTIFGESAGGHSVCQLIVSPTARGLFHAAISQSGICSFPLPTLAEAEARGEALASTLGCDGTEPIACMRGLPLEDIQQELDAFAVPGGLLYQPELPAFPLVDATHLPGQIDALLSAGSHDTSLPIIIGSNTDEAEFFQGTLLSTLVTSEEEMRAALARFWGDATAALIVAEYPVAEYDSPNDALTVATTDGVFACSARRNARALADSGNPTWQYVFAGIPQLGPYPGSFHAAELVFLWDNDSALGNASGRGRAIVSAMQGYWTRFSETGDPNGGEAVPWPSFDTATDEHLRIDFTSSAGAGYLEAKCDFWDGIYDAL